MNGNTPSARQNSIHMITSEEYVPARLRQGSRAAPRCSRSHPAGLPPLRNSLSVEDEDVEEGARRRLDRNHCREVRCGGTSNLKVYDTGVCWIMINEYFTSSSFSMCLFLQSIMRSEA